jgi:hypothetical protein
VRRKSKQAQRAGHFAFPLPFSYIGGTFVERLLEDRTKVGDLLLLSPSKQEQGFNSIVSCL